MYPLWQDERSLLMKLFYFMLGELVSENHKENQNKSERHSSHLICILPVLSLCKEHQGTIQIVGGL